MINIREHFDVQAALAAVERHSELRDAHIVSVLGAAALYEAQLDTELELNAVNSLDPLEFERLLDLEDESEYVSDVPTARDKVDEQSLLFDSRVSKLVGEVGGYSLAFVGKHIGESILSLHGKEAGASVSLVFEASDDDFRITKKSYQLMPTAAVDAEEDPGLVVIAKEMYLDSSDTTALGEVVTRLQQVHKSL